MFTINLGCVKVNWPQNPGVEQHSPPKSNITQALLPEKDTTSEIRIVRVLTCVMALCVLVTCRVFTY
jgi:hypothetical protein